MWSAILNSIRQRRLTNIKSAGEPKMKKLISAKLVGNILLAALGVLFIFHILVLLGVLPADIVWGGQITDSPANPVTLEPSLSGSPC